MPGHPVTDIPRPWPSSDRAAAAVPLCSRGREESAAWSRSPSVRPAPAQRGVRRRQHPIRTRALRLEGRLSGPGDATRDDLTCHSTAVDVLPGAQRGLPVERPPRLANGRGAVRKARASETAGAGTTDAAIAGDGGPITSTNSPQPYGNVDAGARSKIQRFYLGGGLR